MKKSVGYEDLAKQYANKYGKTVVESYDIVKNVAFLIKDNLEKEGDRVFLKDIISLQVVHRNERIGTNPQSSSREQITIPAFNTVRLIVNKGLKEQLKENLDKKKTK